MNKLIISIEGNIGSGKSTFISFLKKNFDDICFVDEPVQEWLNIVDENNNNLIQNFYKDKKKYGYLFQNFAYITRIKKLNDAIKNSKKQIIITERSIESDKYLFAEMKDSGQLSHVSPLSFVSGLTSPTKEHGSIFLISPIVT